ncbi:NAC domain-containing protein 74 [Cardamine amara subsp. amara]|uniref:NAC domain-containing protein 74 n=1 Tax=Cardamine amara subsp. amara TaxID=228776 RepID=A0ABD1AII1_CARAN
MVITRRSQIPGSRFKPKKVELVDHYLRRKIEEGKSYSFIPEIDVYEKEPWLLQHVRHFRTKKNVWFYFVTRQLAGNKKKTNSTRINRKVGGGRWKTNGLLKTVKDGNGVKIGSKQLITFNFKTNIEDTTDKATGWVMHEYLLNKPGFQELALCRIKFKPGNDDARYAPRLESIVVGLPQPQPQPPLGEDLHVAEEVQYNETPHPQHQDFGSCGQFVGVHQQNDILGPYSAQAYDPSQFSMEAQQLCEAQYQQWLVEQQQWNVNSGLYSAQPHDPSQLSMEMQQLLDPQYQQNQLIEQPNHQFSEYSGPYSTQPHDQNHHNVEGIEKKEEDWDFLISLVNFEGLLEDTDLSEFPMEFSTEQQQQDLIIGQNTQFSSHLPYMMNLEEHQYTHPYHQLFGQNYDLSLMVPMETQNQDNATHLSSQFPFMMNQAMEEEQYAQSYHQYFGQSNGLLLVPMETQNQENVIGNSTEVQEQPCEQATDRPINQGIDEPHGGIAGSSTHNQLIQQLLGVEAAMSGHDMVC